MELALSVLQPSHSRKKTMMFRKRKPYRRRNHRPPGRLKITRCAEEASIEKLRAECGLPPLRGKPGKASCLRCGRSFESKNLVLNRICDCCKNSEDWKHPPHDDAALYSSRSSGSRSRQPRKRRKAS